MAEIDRFPNEDSYGIRGVGERLQPMPTVGNIGATQENDVGIAQPVVY